MRYIKVLRGNFSAVDLRCDMYFVDLYCVWKKGRRKISTGFCGSSILKAEIYPEQAKLRKKNLALINAGPKKVSG